MKPDFRRSAAPSLHAPFFGPAAVRGAFVMAMLGWGLGVYGLPVYLHAVVERTGWPVSLVSSAITVHFLAGALVIAGLPRLHGRFGLPATTVGGAALASVGVLGWSLAAEPWQLFAAALASGGGWVTMGSAAINAVVSPWYSARRPRALSTAYNGATIGGVVFSPLWAMLIARIGFVAAAALVGLASVMAIAWLARAVFSRTPESMGQRADGLAADAVMRADAAEPAAPAAPIGALWRDRAFLTLTAGMAMGLFAQMGLIAHLYSLMVPVLGVRGAGFAMGLATACAVAGRTAVARAMPPHADRRRVAAAAYAVQLLGSLALMAAPADAGWLVLAGVVLFGLGLGNANTLPPLIAQREFAEADQPRAVALMIAISQATYAFAPAVFGAVIAFAGVAAPAVGRGAAPLFLAAALVQAGAIAALLAGRGARAGDGRPRQAG
ncbi:MFS transporter [Zeimonas sediminis]|uniref:MFS transporter n=1 Tax=Zeimonas sediminis TaxID=2944268 RepID=UPI003AF056D9